MTEGGEVLTRIRDEDIPRLEGVIEALRGDEFDLSIEGEAVVVNGVLGDGGTKRVYDVTFNDGNRYALALPNGDVDGAFVMSGKWNDVLTEPPVAEKIRPLGVWTHPLMEAVGVKVNGFPFTAIKMSRYQDLPVSVRDRKDPFFKLKPSPYPLKLDKETLRNTFRPMFEDLVVLARNGVSVGGDSLIMCWEDAERAEEARARVFLHDLSCIDFDQHEWTRSFEGCSHHILWGMIGFCGGMSWKQNEENKDFFESQDYKDLERELVQELLEASS